MKKNIPYRNRTPTGWWVASYIERVKWDNEGKLSSSSKCFAWENTIILRAPNREAAYKKAIRLGSVSAGSKIENEAGNRSGKWVFEGLTSLLPIYEDLTDGSEILWKDHSGRTFKKVRSLVKGKKQLEVFNDKE